MGTAMVAMIDAYTLEGKKPIELHVEFITHDDTWMLNTIRDEAEP